MITEADFNAVALHVLELGYSVDQAGAGLAYAIDNDASTLDEAMLLAMSRILYSDDQLADGARFAFEAGSVDWSAYRPVRAEKVFPTPEDGWDYKTVTKVLFSDDLILPPLAVIYDADISAAEAAGADHVNVVFRGLTRGKGKTHGYHERTVAIPLKIAATMAHSTYSAYLASKGVA